jgi:heterodisulfide reductase subunit B
MDAQQDVMIPCSACYLNLKKAAETMREDPLTRDRVNTVLAENDLTVKGTAKVRHLLDVLATDLGAAAIREKVKVDLSHLTIAPYYGCQCLRPYPVFDDPEEPRSMEPLIRPRGPASTPGRWGPNAAAPPT